MLKVLSIVPKAIFCALVVLAVAVVAYLSIITLSSAPSSPGVVTLLQSVPQNFLATSRSETLHITHIDDSGLLLGPREGVAQIRVTGHAGLDLSRVGPNDVRHDGSVVHIKLPEPTVLSVEPDLTSYRITTRESAARRIVDNARGHPLREELFDQTGQAIAEYRKAFPTEAREAVIDRLNREKDALFGPDLQVKFE